MVEGHGTSYGGERGKEKTDRSGEGGSIGKRLLRSRFSRPNMKDTRDDLFKIFIFLSSEVYLPR